MRIKDIAVHLRERELPSGRIELLLDYTFNGKRTRKTTGLYLEAGKTRAIKSKNEEVRIAAAEKRKMLEDKLNGRSVEDDYLYFTLFFDYFKNYADKKKEQTKEGYYSTLSLMNQYEKDKNITISEISPKWVEGFISFLRKNGRKQNTIVSHIRKLRACLNAAVLEGIIRESPTKKASLPKLEETNKSFLTPEELKLLASTEKRNRTSIKEAFLFSCMTGLRFCDVKALKWKNVVELEDGRCALSFRQIKTGQQEFMPINDNAVKQMGERKENDTLVFGNMSGETYTNKFLTKWINKAGINKHITYHSSRHTFATILLSRTRDLFLVSKMLGHRNIETTKVYAKLIYEDKQSAVDKLNDLF